MSQNGFDENQYYNADDQIAELQEQVRQLKAAGIETINENTALRQRLEKAEGAGTTVRVVSMDGSLDPVLIAHAEEEFSSPEGRRRTRTVESLDLRGCKDFSEVVAALNEAMQE